ncbi:hypothetical protein GGI24_005292, partial [Coemansia furcata]
MDNVLAANVDMVGTASSKPDEDFEALLLQYQNSASGPMSSSEPTTISADAYGEIPERSSYYDYDSGRVIYGVDRYSAVAPAPAFGGGGGGQVDRSLGYYYQGSQWPIPGLSYFPGPMAPQQQQSQQPDQSTFNMLNQYHMQLRMLMSPSPRPAPAQRVGPAEPFVEERYGQQAYPPPPPLPPAALPSLQLPSYTEYSSYGSSAPPSAEPMHCPASVRPAIDDGQLSDGELESVSGDYDHGYIGTATAGVDGMEAASQHEGQQDVEGVAKERISQMLKVKDPKLLQSSSFRALMLLLKCIRLDDPDDIYAAVRSAPTQVIAELNALSAEFGLGMITEACVSTLLTDNSSALRANLELGAAEAAATATPLAGGGSSAARSREGSLSTAGSESSTPDSDMDTSSDVDYEDEPSQPPAFAQAGGSKPGTGPMAHFSRETTPQFQARFSRSRAPSPPSAQPRTPRRMSYGRGSPTPPGAEGRGRIAGSGLSMGNSRLFNEADRSWRVQTPRVAESTVCASGTDRLVVYLDDSHSDSESSADGGGSGDDELRARDRARRLDNRMINRECLRLAQEDELQGSDGGSGRQSRVAT